MIIYNKQIQQSLQRANFPFSRTESGHFNVPLSKNLVKYIIKHFGTYELLTFDCNPKIEAFFLVRENINPLCYFWIMRVYGRPSNPTTLDLPHPHMVDVEAIVYIANSVATSKITEQEVRKTLVHIYDDARTSYYGGYLYAGENDQFEIEFPSVRLEELLDFGSEVTMRLYIWRYLVVNYPRFAAYWQDYGFVDKIMPNRFYKSLEGAARTLYEMFGLTVYFSWPPSGRPRISV